MEIKLLKLRFRGAALLEMALVLQFLLLLTLGVIHYGWLFLKAQQITNAARSGARVAIRPSATWAEVNQAVDTALASAGIGTNIDPVITPGLDVGTGEVLTVRLSVSTSVPGVSLMNIPLLPTPENLRASVTMAKEGPGP